MTAWRFPAVTRTDVGGLTVRACHLPGQRLASIRLVLPGGAAAEPADACGITTLAARALVGDALAARAETYGAVLDVETSWDAVALVATLPADRLRGAFDVLAAALAGTDGLPVAGVRARRLEELTREDAHPVMTAARRLAATVYGPGSRYGRPLHGDAASVAMLDTDTVARHRDALARTPGATLVVAGDLDGLDVDDAAARAFDTTVRADVPAPPIAAAVASTGLHAVVLDRPGTGQSVVVLGAPTPPRTAPGHVPVALAVACLTGTDGRLNRRLRAASGTAYRVTGGVEAHRRGGLFGAWFGCATEAVAEAVTVAFAEVDDLAADVTATDLVSARAAQAASVTMHLQWPPGLTGALAEAAVLGLPDDAPARLHAAYLATPAFEVAAAANAYLTTPVKTLTRTI